MKEKSNKKRIGFKKWIVVCCVLLAVCLAVGQVVFIADICANYPGGVIRKVTVTTQNRNELKLNIKYFVGCGGYSVREVPFDEGEYVGDGMIDYDGSLGKYRIIVKFGELSPHLGLMAKCLFVDNIPGTSDARRNDAFVLKNARVSLRARFACPSDSGIVLYIGSDTPIHVETVRIKNVDFSGTIRIPIFVGEAK